MMGRRVWTSEEMEAQRGACSHLHWTPVSRKPGYNQLCAHHPGPQEKQDSLPQVSVYIPRPAPGGPTPPHPPDLTEWWGNRREVPKNALRGHGWRRRAQAAVPAKKGSLDRVGFR